MQLSRVISSAITAIIIMSMFFSEYSLADIYKYTDDSGVIHLTNVPTKIDAKYVLVWRERRVQFNRKAGMSKFDHLITRAANKYNIDEDLIRAVIKTESNFNHRAVSPVGARGLMQLMPATANSLNVHDSFHPESNIEGGVRYLNYLLKRFKGNLPLALAAYNAGAGAVIRHNYRIPPYRETQEYVRRVLSSLKYFEGKGFNLANR